MPPISEEDDREPFGDPIIEGDQDDEMTVQEVIDELNRLLEVALLMIDDETDEEDTFKP